MHNELNPIQTKDINAYYLLPTFGTENFMCNDVLEKACKHSVDTTLSLSPTMSHKCLLRAECILSRTSAAVDE
jgi:hypothetical protein